MDFVNKNEKDTQEVIDSINGFANVLVELIQILMNFYEKLMEAYKTLEEKNAAK